MMPRQGDRLFWAYVVAFMTIFLAFYPSTYAIEDEFNILSLAVALSRGTVFLDRAGIHLDADILWRGHTISKFSPFHAALFVAPVLTSWRLAFALTALFTVIGALVVRSMLRREGLSSAWAALYFLCAGLWFYSRTLMAAVPAAVMVLLGASLLLRERSRPATAGAALSAGGLLHPWMIPVAVALAIGWWLDSPRARSMPLLRLVAAALPAAVLLLFYNALITGSAFRNGYSLLGTQYGFKGEHVLTFFPLYAASLLLMPLAGWTALSPRWSRGLAVPIATATVLVMASLYYFRDGMGYGPAGLLPAQRFLIPASLLACLPAARFLSSVKLGGADAQAAQRRWTAPAAFACFVIGFSAVSFGHQAYLDAHRSVQGFLRASIPNGSRVLAGERAFKEFAPVLGTWQLKQVPFDRTPREPDGDGAYEVWIGAPGQQPPSAWLGDRVMTRYEARSWVWNRDIWIGLPPTATERP